MRDETVVVVAGFDTAAGLLDAARALGAAGITPLEAGSPVPVPGLAATLGTSSHAVPAACLAGGVLGGAGTLFLEWYSAVVDYPLNIGGRPLASWPMFVPAALEMIFLIAALAGFVAFLRVGRLPRLHDATFAAPALDRGTWDGYWLALRPQGEDERARALAVLAGLPARSIEQVPA